MEVYERDTLNTTNFTLLAVLGQYLGSIGGGVEWASWGKMGSFDCWKNSRPKTDKTRLTMSRRVVQAFLAKG